MTTSVAVGRKIAFEHQYFVNAGEAVIVARCAIITVQCMINNAKSLIMYDNLMIL